MTKKLDKHLDAMDPKRRELIKKIAMGAVFSVPSVMSFSLNPAKAQVLSAGCSGNGGFGQVGGTPFNLGPDDPLPHDEQLPGGPVFDGYITPGNPYCPNQSFPGSPPWVEPS